MRKVYIDVMVRIIARVENDIDISDFISEMDYNFTDTTGDGEIEDSEITNWEIVDSK